MVIENNINLSYSDSLIVKQSGFDLKFYFISSSRTLVLVVVLLLVTEKSYPFWTKFVFRRPDHVELEVYPINHYY